MSTTPTRLLCPAALALGLAFTGAHAAELGEATVRSHIGQPLVADVELVDLSAQDLADLQARLASRDVFQGANVAVNPALAGMGIAIVKRDQRRVLHLTTTMPVQSELLHLYFELGSAGRQSVRGVTLWLTPAPPAPPAPPVQATRVVATPVPMPVSVPVPPPAPAPVVEPKKPAPAPIRLSTGTVQLAMAGTPGKGGTRADAELLGAVERAFVARAKQPEPLPAPRKAPVDRKREPEPEPVTRASGVKGVDKATMAKAAEVAPAEKKGAAKASAPAPASVPASAPPKVLPAPAKAVQAAPPTDPAMLTKLAELEAKLKRLQAMVAAKPTAGAPLPAPAAQPAAVAGPMSAASVPAAPGRTATGKITDIRATSVVETKHEAKVGTEAQAKPAEGAAPKAEPKTDAKPEVKAEVKPEAKAEAKPDAKPEAKPAKAKAAPPPPEPPKEKKMSRPKMLTMAAGAIVALLMVAGVVVHWLRRRKARQASAQIKVWQSWRKKAIAEAAAQPEEPSTDSAAEEKAA